MKALKLMTSDELLEEFYLARNGWFVQNLVEFRPRYMAATDEILRRGRAYNAQRQAKLNGEAQ